MATPGQKFDGGKLRYDLVDVRALRALVQVLTHGTAKYRDNGWRTVKGANARYYGALLRHLEAWRAGKWLDNEPDSEGNPGSGLPHLAHAMACSMILLALGIQRRGMNHDKR